MSKTRFFTITLVLAFLLGLQACAQKVEPQADCNFIVNSQKQRVSWQGRGAVVLYIDASVPQEFYSSIQNAAADWNRQLGKEVLRIGGVTSRGSTPARDGTNVIYWSSSWERDRTFEQARTTVSWIGDQIQDADVKVNALDFRFSSANQPIRDYVDFESLMVHEFGHVAQQTTNEALADCWAAKELVRAPNGSRYLNAAIALFGQRPNEHARYGSPAERAERIRGCAEEERPNWEQVERSAVPQQPERVGKRRAAGRS